MNIENQKDVSRQLAKVEKFAKRKSAEQYKRRFLNWQLAMVRNGPHRDLSDKRRRVLLSTWEVIYETIDVIYAVRENSGQGERSPVLSYSEQQVDAMQRFCESSSAKKIRSIVKDFYQFHIAFYEGSEFGENSQIEIFNDFLALYKVIKPAMAVMEQILPVVRPPLPPPEQWPIGESPK